MEWTERMSVGVVRFDDEHRQLIGLINQLYDAVQAGHGRQALGPVLDAMIDYTKTHFEHEEALLRQHNYPTLDAHKAEHEALARQVLDIQRKYHAGASAMLSMEVMSFLKGWLVKHIQGTDRQYGRFLIERGLR
jgi:hemerythrin